MNQFLQQNYILMDKYKQEQGILMLTYIISTIVMKLHKIYQLLFAGFEEQFEKPVTGIYCRQ